MNPDVLLLIFYLALALGVSFACSVFEAVLLSITPGFVANLEREGGKVAERIKQLKLEVDRPLAAILSLNTIAHTVGAAGVGAQSAKVFGDGYIGVTSGVLTVLILIASEIVPKSLGAAYWKRLAPGVSWLLTPLTFLMTITGFVPVARWITGWLGGDPHGAIPSREEISAIAEQGAREGLFLTGESRVLGNLFRLTHLRAADVLTPRTVLFGLPETTKVHEVIAQHEQLRFSRIPIYKDSIDHISGYVLKVDILLRAAQDQPNTPLSELRRQLTAVPQALPLSELFELLLQEQTHVALVVDEYGGTAGLVTMEDLVETLIGTEIMDEADAVPDMQEQARKLWEKRAQGTGIHVVVDAPPPSPEPEPAPPDPKTAKSEPT